MFRTLTLTAVTLLGSLQLQASAVNGPPTYLTRAEAAMLLLTSADIPLLPYEQPLLYPDVLEGEWYVPYLKTAMRMEMFDADPVHGLLHPHHSVSRAEFLKLMAIAYGLSRDIPYPYTDVPHQAWYRPYAGIAYREGLFRDSKEPLLLHPDMRVTQEEAVATITTVLRTAPHLQDHPAAELKQALKTAEQGEYATTVTSQEPATLPDHLAVGPLMVKEAMRRLFANRSSTVDDVRLQILQRVNAERREAGMHILRHNTLLATAAQAHARDMQKRGYFSHFSPEGLSYVDRIRSVGYLDSTTLACPCTPMVNTVDLLQNRREIGPNYVLAKSGDQCECSARFALGENIAKGQLSPTQVMDDWMRSPNHRRNIMSGAFDEIGIGIFGDIWVQEFGRLETQ